MLLTVIAFVIGILLAQTFMPVFQEMTGIALAMPWDNLFFVPILLVSAALVGGIAGFYPSIYLSGFAPINVLKGKLRLGSKSGGFQTSLVVFQFTVSIILIIGPVEAPKSTWHIIAPYGHNRSIMCCDSCPHLPYWVSRAQGRKIGKRHALLVGLRSVERGAE